MLVESTVQEHRDADRAAYDSTDKQYGEEGYQNMLGVLYVSNPVPMVIVLIDFPQLGQPILVVLTISINIVRTRRIHFIIIRDLDIYKIL